MWVTSDRLGGIIRIHSFGDGRVNDEWVFDINVPIGLAISLLSIKYISTTTRRTHENKHHLDIFGAVSVTAGLMLLVYSLNSSATCGGYSRK
jgi:hypothetical protein